MTTLSTSAECAELFVKTLEELNAVSQLQMQGILNVVIAGLEAAKSPVDDKGDAIQKLSELVDELKNASTNKVPVQQPAAPSDQNSDKFCADVEAALNIAMQNSAANQQALNELGLSALGKVIALLIKLQDG